MTPRRYIVLRNRREAGMVFRSAPRPLARGIDGACVGMAVDLSDAAGASRARADGDFEAAAPSMTMKLIGPVIRHAAVAHPGPGTEVWGIRAVGADTSRFTGSGTVVAVLDTGIDRTHPAFAGVHLIEKDFTGDGDGDHDGHGTHCAATLFGRDVEGTRIGVARGVQTALIGKVIGRNGGETEHIVRAVQWAIDNGANVISMSLGIDFPGYQAALQDDGLKAEVATSMALEAYRANIQLFDRLAALVSALAQFRRQPCLLIAASGNESGRTQLVPYEIAASPPAASEGFVAVAALQQGSGGFEVSGFSNTGAVVSAPGVRIVSAHAGGGVIAFDGTSMAVPHVAGVAALWAEKLQSAGSFGAKLFSANLLGSATKEPLDPSCSPDAVGAGIVRAPQS